MSESVDRVTEIAGRVAAAGFSIQKRGDDHLVVYDDGYGPRPATPIEVALWNSRASKTTDLLERLRTAEAERGALRERLLMTEGQRDTIQRRTEERESKRYHAAIGNWKSIAQTAEARAAEAEAVIVEAPHSRSCRSEEDQGDDDAYPCDCWKSTYRAGADHE